MTWDGLFTLGFILVLAGMALAMLSVILSALGSARSRGRGERVRGGGVVVVGPIPIVFGSDRGTVKLLLVLGIVLSLILLALTLLPYLGRW